MKYIESKIEICAVGGFSEIGKNMTAIKYGNEVVICDMGLFLPKIIGYVEAEQKKLSRERMIEIEAIPDDNIIEKWRHLVKAIVLGHSHLDHIGAAPFLAKHYNCDVIGTPYSIEILKEILKDYTIKLPNKLVTMNVNSSVKVSENIKIEFLNMTHSTLQCAMVVIHTPLGAIVYANDYKFDNTPILGKKPNIARLKELGKTKKVLAVIVESLYASQHVKTPSEKVAREMLEEIMLETKNQGNMVVVTTFASHLARIKSIVDFGRKMGRKIIFMGRSLDKYVKAAERIKIVNFSKYVEISGYKKQTGKRLKYIEQNREKYLIVCTGHQGEPNSTLVRMASGGMGFKFRPGDQVIFASRVIPDPINVANRIQLEELLDHQGVRVFCDVHTSGHASREDHRDLINMLKPRHIIPAHADITKQTDVAELAIEMGYAIGKNIHMMSNGQKIELN